MASKSQKFQLLGDRVAVLPSLGGTEQKGKGGLVFVEKSESGSLFRGEVVAVGPGKMKDGKVIPMTVKVGDEVLFRKGFGDDKAEVKGEECYVVTEDEVLAIVS